MTKQINPMNPTQINNSIQLRPLDEPQLSSLDHPFA